MGMIGARTEAMKRIRSLVCLDMLSSLDIFGFMNEKGFTSGCSENAIGRALALPQFFGLAGFNSRLIRNLLVRRIVPAIVRPSVRPGPRSEGRPSAAVGSGPHTLSAFLPYDT